MPLPRLVFSAESLFPGNGGISRVARLTARVLAEEVQAGRLRARAIVLSDSRPAPGIRLPLSAAARSRLRFVLRVQRAAVGASHFFYDHLGMARAHCRLPLLRRPFMTFVYGIEVWENAARHRISWARRADALVAITEYTRARADRAHGGFGRAPVCWLSTETDEAPAGPGGPAAGPPAVTIVARLGPEGYKGHRELIAAWPRVTAAVPDARLLVVGSGPHEESLRRQAAQAGGRIEFLGFVPDERMHEVWARTSVFAMPSRGEGFGLVYIEAMRQGLPVIASVHDAAPEVSLDGVTGYNVNLDRPDELPERLIHLLRDRDHAAGLGRNGRRRWAEHFRYSAFRKRFAPLLADFLG